MKGLLVAWTCAAVLAAPAFALAEPTPAQVRAAAEAFDRGREAYKQEEFTEAAEQFERADGNAPSSAALELAIRARDKAGELDRAATLAALGLKRHPDDAAIRKLAGDVLHRAGQSLFELTVRCPEACELTAGGKIVHGGAASERTLYLEPGSIVVLAGWDGERSESKTVEATRGGRDEIAFEAPPETRPEAPSAAPAPEGSDAPDAAAPGEPPAKRSGLPTAVFWTGVAATAVAGGVTIWSGVDTQNDPGADRVRDECVGQGESCDLYQQGLDKQRRTNILLGVTAGLGVATIVVGALFTDWGGAPAATETAKPSLRVSPWASWDGGGFAASGRF